MLLSPEAFARATDVSRETLAKLEIHAGLLRKFQRTINIVGRDTLKDLWTRHFLDSAQVFPLLPAPPTDRPQRLIDLGSGAGFPGLVLAIMAQGAGRPLTVRLIEADARKAAFLREVARQTKAPASIENQRLEALEPGPPDIITARAFAPLPRLLDLAAPLLGPPAPVLLLHKGRQAREELTRAKEGWNMRVETFPSVTDEAAVVLRIEDIRRV